jgi:hypothetical protein
VPIRSTADGAFYYTGQGATLNDINGTERDESGTFYTGSH